MIGARPEVGSPADGATLAHVYLTIHISNKTSFSEHVGRGRFFSLSAHAFTFLQRLGSLLQEFLRPGFLTIRRPAALLSQNLLSATGAARPHGRKLLDLPATTSSETHHVDAACELRVRTMASVRDAGEAATTSPGAPAPASAAQLAPRDGSPDYLEPISSRRPPSSPVPQWIWSAASRSGQL